MLTVLYGCGHVGQVFTAATLHRQMVRQPEEATELLWSLIHAASGFLTEHLALKGASTFLRQSYNP